MTVRMACVAAALLAVVACSGLSANPSLDVVSFDPGGYIDAQGRPQPCGFGFACMTLVASSDGTQSGLGSCDVWPITTGGERLGDAPAWSSGELEISSGETYRWEVQALIPAGDKWRGEWDAICRPAPEG